MKKQFDARAHGLDEAVIHEIMTRRRCDFIKRPRQLIIEIQDDGRSVKFAFEGNEKARREFTKRHGIETKRRKSPTIAYDIRRLTALINNKNISSETRTQCAVDRENLRHLRRKEKLWAGTEKRTKELKEAGKIIKTLREIQNEQILDLLKYVLAPGHTQKESHKIVVLIWNALPDELKISKRLTSAKVKWTYDNALKADKIKF